MALSRAGHPKQFLALSGDETMLQQTVDRLKGLPIKTSVTICNEASFLAEQLRAIDRNDHSRTREQTPHRQ